MIDPEEKEFKEIIKNARRKLETPMAPAMPCKTCEKNKNGRPVTRLMISNQNLRVFWKPVNPQDCVSKNLYRITIRTMLQKRGQLTATLRFGTQFVPMPQAMKIPAAKSSSG